MLIVKVSGVNGLGKTNGVRNAGNVLIEEINKVERVEEIHVDNDNLDEQEKLIERNSRDLFLEEDKIIFLGGDHSISYPIGKAFFKKYPSGKLVVFDAHADCMPAMKEPTHEEWLRGLVDNFDVSGDRIMIIGLNKVEPEEKEFIEEKGIKTIKLNEVGKLKEFVFSGEVYVSFDIDIFSFDLVQATRYPEGVASLEEINALLDVVVKSNWKGMDLVEVNTDKEGLEDTVEIARGVLDKFIS